jgi:hypothetical protein
MPTTKLTLRLGVDYSDLIAFHRDLFDIFMTYGLTEEDCHPHDLGNRAAELHRAGETLKACMYVVESAE